MSDKYLKLKVKELQEILQKNGLPHTGKKEELIERLVKHDEEKKTLEIDSLEAEFGNLEEFDETKLNLDELNDTDLKSFQQQKSADEKPANSTTTTTSSDKKDNSADSSLTAADNSNNTNDDNTLATKKDGDNDVTKPVKKEGTNFQFTPIVFDKKANESNVKSELSDAEKKIERAKRFGVQVNESTKQELRAKRFGTSNPTSNQPVSGKKHFDKASPAPAAKGVDPEVLKKRAERFGLNKPTPTTKLSAEDEEKKRKRAERFASDSNKKAKN